jgi:hypothetical protein
LGYLVPNVMINSVTATSRNMVPIMSDENFKTNVEDVGDPTTLLSQLIAKRYEYRTEEFPHLGLADGLHWGFIAQEVEQVMPDLVHQVVIPAVLDSLGNETHPSLDLRTLNYMGLIPLLVESNKQQQQMLDEQASALNDLQQIVADMQQALALCCTNPSDGQQLQTPGDGIEGRMLPDAGSERLLTIAPNPFTEQTTVSYTLERGGRAMLMVNGSDGKHLQVLEEGARSEGQYQYVWHTAHLAPGVYYVTLLLDGEPLVKRAVKVN